MALDDPQKEIPQLTGHRWYFAGVLGSGGQGTVYKVRSRDAHEQRLSLLGDIAGAVESISGKSDREGTWRLKLAEAITTYGRGEPPSAFGALKILHLKEDSDAAKQAQRRFEAEIEALRKVQHPSILRVLDADASAKAKWMVTDLQPGRTLADSLHNFSGQPLVALRAFRPLVAAVAALHAVGVIHRDIKPGNIFIAADGHLVLGDFGITFFEDGRERLTETFERVGTRDWMAPWANLGIRIDDVKPTFDVFPLGKVLYCMVSEQRLLPLWYVDDQKYNQYRLTTLLPGVAHLDMINDILRRCVVQHEEDCVATAGDLLKLVDERLSILELGGDILRLDTSRPCRVCARGQYVFWPPDGQASIQRVITAMPEEFVLPQPTTEIQPYFRIGSQAFWFRLFTCTQCGHVQLFWCPDRKLLPAWESPRT